MSKRVTVNLPDDVAERIGVEPNASAYVAAVLRREIDRERGLAELAEHFGPQILADDSRARGRARLSAARAQFPAERYAELRERFGLKPAS